MARGFTLMLTSAMVARLATGADCSVTSVGKVPLNDLGAGTYLGLYQGGLYPGGLNTPPAMHLTTGQARAAAVVPLNLLGNPDPSGKYVLLSIGMSNTTQEFCGSSLPPCAPWTFGGQAAASPQVNHTTLAIVNGAAGGQTSVTWDQPTDANYDRVRDMVLAPQGLSEAQVQVVWIKTANAGPTISLPNAAADANALVTHIGNIARAVKVRYPNVKIVLLSSRIYAGYASTMLNREPYAYESAFGVKWAIESQIAQMAGQPAHPLAGDLNYTTVAPFLAWGPYLWADGLTPRSDGLTWACADLEADGTHPSMSGEQKVGQLLMNFMLTSPFASPWFRAAGAPCYANCDQSTTPPVLNINDFSCFLNRFASGSPYANCDLSTTPPVLNVNDFSCFVNRFAAGCT
ncbi:MAG: GC-type dockerin domain-anchored protein [Phycisphaerales bacterium]